MTNRQIKNILTNFFTSCLKPYKNWNNVYRKENKKLLKVEKGKLSERTGRKVMGLKHDLCYDRQTTDFNFFR